MINGAHAILYSDDADATRPALVKVLGTRTVDADGGWPILALPPAEIAVHPASKGDRAELYLLCDDLAVVAQPVQQPVVQSLPHPGLLPVSQPPPTGHAAAAAQLLGWEQPPGQPRPGAHR
jgi:hypothetical protein